MDLLMDIRNGVHDNVFVNGECPVVTDPIGRVMQRLKIKLLTFRGEWFHNVDYGVPYWQEILGQKTTKSRVDVIFQEAILEEQGVVEIISFNSSLYNREYSLEVKIRARDTTNNTTRIETLSLGNINI